MEDLVALRVDRLALLVDDVVVLHDALADVEVVALDAGLGVLDGLGHQPRLDGHVTFEAHPLHEAGHALGREPLHERVLEGQVEARRPRVALAAGTTAELVVDAARVVTLGADDVQAARRDHLLVLGRGLRLGLGQRRGIDVRLDLGGVETLLVERRGRQALGVAAELDVRAAAGHVGGDGHGTQATGLGHDGRFLLVELGVEHLVLDASPLRASRRAPRSSRR